MAMLFLEIVHSRLSSKSLILGLMGKFLAIIATHHDRMDAIGCELPDGIV
jgi:hypothetical protein